MSGCCCGMCDDDILSDRRETFQLLREVAQVLRDHNKPSLAIGIDDLISELDLI